MNFKPVNVLLIGADLRDVLVRFVDEKAVPLQVVSEPPTEATNEHGSDAMAELVSSALEHSTGVTVYAADMVRVDEFENSDGADLYLSVVNLDEFEEAIAAHAGWMRVPLRQAKFATAQSPLAAMASVFQAVDRSNAATREMLESFLRHLSRDVESEQVHWLDVRDGDCGLDFSSEFYCSECCYEKVEEIAKDFPNRPYEVAGGFLVQVRSFPECETCGKMLHANLVDYGVIEEVEKICSSGLNLEGEGADWVARRLLELLDFDSRYFDAMELELLDMVRRDERVLLPRKLQHIPKNLVVAGAARYDTVEDVERALDNGGDPNAIDPESGFHAAHWACTRLDAAMLELLLSRGATPECLPSVMKHRVEESVLHMAVAKIKLLDTVLPYVRDVDVRNGFGRTALHMLCANVGAPRPISDNVELAIKRLLDAGADPFAADRDGLSPMWMATMHGENDFSRLFRGYHAAVMAKRAIAKSASEDQADLDSLRPLAP